MLILEHHTILNMADIYKSGIYKDLICVGVGLGVSVGVGLSAGVGVGVGIGISMELPCVVSK